MGRRIEVYLIFLYEFLWDFFVFLFLIFLRKYKKKEGDILGFYLIFYFIGRFFIEVLRIDSLMIGNFRVF